MELKQDQNMASSSSSNNASGHDDDTASVASSNASTGTSRSDYSSYQDTMQVENRFVGKLIGKKGSTKNRLERRFRVKLQFPSKRDSSNDNKQQQKDASASMATIRISSSSMENIGNVKQEMERIITGSSRDATKAASKRTPPPTHFLSLPLNDEVTQDYFNDLTSRVMEKLAQNSDHEYDENLFQRPVRAHLTLQVLHLLSEDQVEQALSIFKEIDLKEYGFSDDINTGDSSLPHIKFGSLGAFSRKSLEQTYVVYLKVADSPVKELILKMAADLKAKFMEADLIQDKKELTLHVTFMNLKFLNKKGSRLFNAKPVFEAYEEVQQEMIKEKGANAHHIPLTSLDLSKMKSKSKDVYYDYEDQIYFGE